MLVSSIAPWGIGDLLRAIWPRHPDVDVVRDVRLVENLPVGSKLILVPRVGDAWALNMARPIFSRRELKVILACDRQTSEAILKDAPDFFDWISIYVEWPEKPPPFAVQGIRRSLEVRAPGIVWLGSSNQNEEMPRSLQSAFDAALSGRRLIELDPLAGFADIVDTIRKAKADWPYTHASDPRLLRRIRWALVDARRRVGSVFRAEFSEGAPRAEFSQWLAGYIPVDDRIASFEDAAIALRNAGGQHPERLAALLAYEPDAISLCAKLLQYGENESNLTERLLHDVDQGAVVAQLAVDRRLLTAEETDLACARPPVVRALATREKVQQCASGIDDPVLNGPRRLNLEQAALHAFEVGDYGAAISWGERLVARKNGLVRNKKLWLRLGETLVASNEQHRGLSYLRHAAEHLVEPDDPLYAEFMSAFVRALVKSDQISYAKTIVERSITTVNSRLSNRHFAIAVILLAVAELYRNAGNDLAAELILQRLVFSASLNPTDNAITLIALPDDVKDDFPRSSQIMESWWRTCPTMQSVRWRACVALGHLHLWKLNDEQAELCLSMATKWAEKDLSLDSKFRDSLGSPTIADLGVIELLRTHLDFSPSQRIISRMRFFHQVPILEIAKTLGISRSTAYLRIQRVRNALLRSATRNQLDLQDLFVHYRTMF